jgi:hypothetical protein
MIEIGNNKGCRGIRLNGKGLGLNRALFVCPNNNPLSTLLKLAATAGVRFILELLQNEPIIRAWPAGNWLVMI